MTERGHKFGFSGFRLEKTTSHLNRTEKLSQSVLTDNEVKPNLQSSNDNESSFETDPLDAFMENLEKQCISGELRKNRLISEEVLMDSEDPITSYLDYRDKQAAETDASKETQDEGLTDDEEVEAVKKRKVIHSLEPLEPQSFSLQPFQKNFWTDSSTSEDSKDHEKLSKRTERNIHVSGECPGPIVSFYESKLPETLLRVIKEIGYDKPTPIQAQAIPAILYGCNVLGIAQTGSGKTAAYSLPMIRHVWAQPRPKRRQGPIALVTAPTRELAQQIASEIRKLGASKFNLRVLLTVGGDPKYEQIKSLREGVDILVGTPGRIIDLIKSKGCSLQQVTFLVLDEADRMLDLGFEPQVRSILGQIRPDRQVCLFSATFRNRVQQLVRETIAEAVKITIGEAGSANEDIMQLVKFVSSEDEKMSWLYEHLPQFLEQGNVIVFVGTRASCASLTNQLRSQNIATCSIHGETSQEDREGFLKLFRTGDVRLLVSTDLASRGLDIEQIHTVINFETPKNIEWYVHRIGRTGRAGRKGTAYTLLTAKDKPFARELEKYFRSRNQAVPAELQKLIYGFERSVKSLQNFTKAKYTDE
ncbi:hypothetical protein GpartN1_g4636.t1 [Galdieria partita]|uniref:RNA helicase n=1 Tax=Galdieria partita TaxID=83374 RepID=A0A9C7PYP4_9RHOD|nr:hypothetical protein GpartN1_g4636.t1 [Galdieria partita]